MCGIVGILGKETEKKDVLVRDMAQAIIHRGPDEDGFFTDEYVALGMRRLSIIDLSGGHQPITSADGSTMIFFNGEIYNYKELREELLKKGYAFKTDSDTETILHLYEAYGKAGLTKLRGMFAFAIYDKQSHTLFLARDYFGIKPLYYFKKNNQVVAFASEIKALLDHPAYEREINDEALFNYLRFQYNPLEETFFKHIFSLRPGHSMTIDFLSGTYTTEKFWKFEFAVDRGLSEEKAEAKTSDVMRDSVAHHMIADVPVGGFLSGGVDSSIIVTLMDEVRNKNSGVTSQESRVKTFTIGWNELSEGSAAKETSDMLGTDHTEIVVGPDEYFSILPKLAWHFDEPVADPSAIALYFVAREARKKVKVVLSGEGADELFGGYNIYRAPLAAKKLAWLPKSFLALAARLMPDMWGKNYLKRASSRLEDWYIGNASVFSKTEQQKIWKAKLEGEVPALTEAYAQATTEKISDSATMELVDINTWLVGDILAKADKMTMANSLELRVPFLDIEVANLARTLPDELRWKNGATKYVLRKAFENIVPKSTAHRRKLGFPTPIREWFTAERTDIYDLIRASSLLQSHLNMPEVEKVIADHVSKKQDNSRKIYLLYMLALWHQVFFENWK